MSFHPSQSTRGCKGSSGSRSCHHGLPSGTSGFWGCPLPNFCSPCSRPGVSPVCSGADICCAGSPIPSLVGSSDQSPSPGCGSPTRAHVPAQTPICRNECIFLNTWADKNHVCFGLVFPSCFSACVFPRAEWDFVYALPRFPTSVGPGTVPPRCPQCRLSPWTVGPVSGGLYKALKTQAPQTAHHSGKPWAL